MRAFLEQFSRFCNVLQVPVFIVKVDDQGDIRFGRHNQAHADVTGLKPGEIDGKTPHELLPARQADILMRNYQQCVSSKEPLRYESLLHINRRDIWWETTLSPVIDDGVVIGIIGIAQEISERKQSEFRFADALQELGQANADLEVLISTTAHDLRGPLRQARLINEMVLDGFEDLGDNKLELLNTSSDVLDRSMRQIDDILSESRKIRQFGNRAQQFNFGQMCAELSVALDPLQKFEFDFEYQEIIAEKFILDICLRNLIDNATKHAAGRIRIRLRPGDGELTITVADDGPGFLADAIDSRLKDPEIASVSGYGLPGVRRLLEARRGRLSVDPPQFQTGATVSFSIPGKLVGD